MTRRPSTRVRWWSALVAGVLALALLGMPAAVAGAGVEGRPDARIRVGGTYKGDDRYNATGDFQARWAATRVGLTIDYKLSFQNDGVQAEALRVRGRPSTAELLVRYEDAAGTDITAEVVAGTYLTPVLDPQEKVNVHLLVRVRPGARVGVWQPRIVRVFSTLSPTVSDTVRTMTERVDWPR